MLNVLKIIIFKSTLSFVVCSTHQIEVRKLKSIENKKGKGKENNKKAQVTKRRKFEKIRSKLITKH